MNIAYFIGLLFKQVYPFSKWLLSKIMTLIRSFYNMLYSVVNGMLLKPLGVYFSTRVENRKLSIKCQLDTKIYILLIIIIQ